ncbi:MAG: YicC family protein [Rikenellaceae bacterium]|nr:YicC family protein [Rikenellaceae bacterium]
MIKSMTGYGKAEAVSGDTKITAEIRSLNSKQFDFSVKCPSVYRSADNELRAIVSGILVRGKVDLYINCESAAGTAPVKINSGVFADYYNQLQNIASDNGIPFGNSPEGLISVILRMPEVVENNSENLSEEEKTVLLETVKSAAESLDAFRISEGAILIADILERVGYIESAVASVEPFEAERIDTVKSRIRENIEKAQLNCDENRLEQELIYYIEKFDVTEEKVRLRNHCNYFREVAAGEDNPGKKLGFIAQEMGREINTLGSKANHSRIQKIVVGMKDELEKIKEQLLNIL